MLNKKPSSRITIDQIKSHPYFSDIDWNLLAERKVNPPIMLLLDEEYGSEGNHTIEGFNGPSAEDQFLNKIPGE